MPVAHPLYPTRSCLTFVHHFEGVEGEQVADETCVTFNFDMNLNKIDDPADPKTRSRMIQGLDCHIEPTFPLWAERTWCGVVNTDRGFYNTDESDWIEIGTNIYIHTLGEISIDMTGGPAGVSADGFELYPHDCYFRYRFEVPTGKLLAHYGGCEGDGDRGGEMRWVDDIDKRVEQIQSRLTVVRNE